MKLVVAYIRPECLGAVKQKLYTEGLYSMSVTNILGSGRQKGYVELYRGIATEVTLLKKVRLELCLHEENVQKAMDAIAAGAATGHEGDGIIYVVDVVQSRRIRTGDSL
ncbi:P-II family nitrogen regulator [Mailhella massiliensis]|uniref:P-II family nitrogen regulator n=1 Tax=Mailhella massiliensis TaxID=1903261 RepID=A0A921DT25_9BACT|nr:P-II family nitrogen regulator [Mailhella massiliensis]HJD97622.1 P-II family nitrogen regulator [Mailhella massiliensis]